jgi:hypothetical protein
MRKRSWLDFKLLSRNLSWETRSGHPVNGPVFKAGTSPIRRKIANQSITTFECYLCQRYVHVGSNDDCYILMHGSVRRKQRVQQQMTWVSLGMLQYFFKFRYLPYLIYIYKIPFIVGHLNLFGNITFKTLDGPNICLSILIIEFT